jgi:aldehyde dehydrogenase (NAD+)
MRWRYSLPMEHSAIETETADLSSPQPRLDQLRKTVDEGVYRSLSWRLAQLDGLLQFVSDHEDAMLAALKADLGRCAAEARLADILMVRSELKLIRRNLRRWLQPRRVHTPIAAQPAKSWLQQEPYGLALILGTWNYPFQQILLPLAGALAAGNAAVVKLPELAIQSVSLMATHLPQYVDPGAVIVFTGGEETASRLLAQRFDKIFYTGSSRVGRIVMKAAAEHLTPVTLELGGKNPALVAPDAPLDVTARRLAWGRFINAGQICVAPDYILIPEPLRLAFIQSLGRAILRFYGPNPQGSTSYGRIVSQQHFTRLVALMGEGRTAIGGNHDAADRYIAPTVLTDLPADAAVMQEEIFGPLLPVIGYQTIEEAVAFIRQRAKPLVLHLFTRDRSLQSRILRDTSSGSVVVNDVVVNQIVPGLPFGGVGDSGMGSFHGRYTFDAFSRSKAVMRRSLWPDPDLRYPPFTHKKDRLAQRLLSL